MLSRDHWHLDGPAEADQVFIPDRIIDFRHRDALEKQTTSMSKSERVLWHHHFMLTVLWSRNNFTHSERLFPYLFHPHISYWKNLGLVSHSPRSSGPIQEQRARALPCATSVESEPHAASILRLQTAIGLAPIRTFQHISTFANAWNAFCFDSMAKQHGKLTLPKKKLANLFFPAYTFSNK